MLSYLEIFSCYKNIILALMGVVLFILVFSIIFFLQFSLIGQVKLVAI